MFKKKKEKKRKEKRFKGTIKSRRRSSEEEAAVWWFPFPPFNVKRVLLSSFSLAEFLCSGPISSNDSQEAADRAELLVYPPWRTPRRTEQTVLTVGWKDTTERGGGGRGGAVD